MYKFHPLADIFPMLEEKDLEALPEDIRASGLTEPITLYEGKVLDGRNRYRACDLAKVELGPYHFIEYEGADALGFVVSKNLHRRHLNESQRAIIAAAIANMTVGGDHSANLQKGQMSQSKAAEIMNVSTRSVSTAKTIEDPDLKDAVKSGKKTVHAAAKAQKARGTTKKGSAAKGGRSIDDMRKTKSHRTRKAFWAAFRKQLNEALAKTKAAIARFETDSEDRPEDNIWYTIAVDLYQATERLHQLHDGEAK